MPKKISVNEPVLNDSEIKAAQTILDSGLLSSSNINGGKYVKDFEKNIAQFLDVKYAVAINSGTSALYASLLSLNIKSGDEVIVPSFSFTATASAVVATGATPVFVDISSSNYNIDISLIKSNITKKTKAIIPVHLYGHPVDVDPIAEITSPDHIAIIEDGAQSLGSSINGKKCGTLGNLGCTSLYPTKVITSGEGGVITTNDETLYEELLRIRNHGLDESGQTTRFGLNLRMPEIESAIASIQLSKLDDFIRIRRRNSDILSDIIGNFNLNLPVELENTFLNRYLYTISLDKSRSEVMNYMEKQGINTAVYYRTPIHKMPYYHSMNNSYNLPNTDIASSKVLSIPIHSGLSEDDVQNIGNKLNDVLKTIY
ncbi:MAG: DegT/DnrJ/EryC1/StrS family aminotransferase [Thaumarchaeota archaeon]|nr:DegT/DnrJ/EryC1/StrS family aminotransferase [Nitrososphaerota archaeon]